MNLKIKVCGLADADNYQQIMALRPDYAGHIFYERSPRYLGPEILATWPKMEDVQRVGVFVNASLARVAEVVAQTRLDAVQLHGQEAGEFCARLCERYPTLTIIKSVALTEGFDWDTLLEYADSCAYFLCDTPSRVQYGGSGRAFDWRLLRGGQWPRPFFLAGGLGLANIQAALNACQGLPLQALDVNSRVETAPGFKSPARVGAFIEQVRNQRFGQQLSFGEC